MRKRIFCTGVFLALFPLFVCADSRLPIKQVRYSDGDNYVASLLVPVLDPYKAPIVIFNYHEDVDRSKTLKVKREVQDYQKFMDAFYQMGIVTLVPHRRDIDLGAVRAAIRYARQMPYGDKRRIYLMGYSEAALLSLLGALDAPRLRGLILITPRSIHETGALSLPEVARKLPKLKTPTLLIVGTGLESGVVHLGRTFHRLFSQAKKPLTYREYNEVEKWFSDPNSLFMEDVKTFIYDDLYEGIEYEDPKPSTPVRIDTV